MFHPTGSLKQAQENVAELYWTKGCIFLVNGASVGIMASIMSILLTHPNFYGLLSSLEIALAMVQDSTSCGYYTGW